MYFRDLESWEELGRATCSLLAVGWLDPNHPFTTGSVDPDFFEALIELLRDPWQPVTTLGFHRCAFCTFTGGPMILDYQGVRVELGKTNLFLPATEVAYVSPSLIAHYIDSHSYRPPEEFCAAVLACPPMRSMEYLRQIS